MKSFHKWHRSHSVTMAALLCLACTASLKAAEADMALSGADMALATKLQEAAQRDDCDTVLRELKPRLGKGTMNPVLEMFAYEIGASCAGQSGDLPLAGKWALERTEQPDPSDYIWHLRLNVDLNLKHFTDAVRTVEIMHERYGAALNSVPIHWLYSLHGDLEKEKLDPERRRLLVVLASGAYVPDELLRSIDGFRRLYAALLVDAGESGTARPIVAAIQDTTVLIDMLQDTRFKGMIAEPFDERALVEKELVVAQAALKAHPDNLMPLIVSASLLRKLGRFQEALSALEIARARDGGPEGYVDADAHLAWWWNSVSNTQMSLGNVDAALRAMRAGADENEGDGLNVSQTINLAAIYLALRQPAEALTTLEAAGEMEASPYGEMQIRQTRGCAAAQLHDDNTARADLAFASAHKEDSYDAYLDLLLCMGDLDGTAKAVIARLDDTQHRVDMLNSLIQFDPPPPPMSQAPIYLAMQALFARGDVSAALERAGGRQRIRLQDAE